ncbi:MAG: hypothetical protein CMB80_01920 [Flammeovirgaceae bacterium]|nr:hypothetical protein [Flammeovirgaceae bacterium]
MTTETAVERITREMSDDVDLVTEKVNDLAIVDQKSFDVTTEFMVQLQGRLKQVKKHFKPMKEATQKAHKAIVAQEKAMLAPLNEADAHLRYIRAAWADAQEEIRRKKQEKMDKAADLAAKKKEERLREKAEKETDPEKKADLEEQADNTYANPNIASGGVDKSSKVEGGGSTSWIEDIEVEVTHPLELLEEIISGRVPQTVYEFKPAKLKAWVKANDIKIGQIPGIMIKKTRRESVRTG